MKETTTVAAKPSLIQNEHLTRQSDLIDSRTLNKKVIIIGCGAIGSFTTLALAKMGMTNIEVFDFDEVDTVNMNGQFFRFKDIGTNKARALFNLVKDFTETSIRFNEVAFTEEHKEKLKDAIVISAVDSMEVRKLIMTLGAEVGVAYIIDPRMGAEQYAQYCYTPETFDKYAKTLYSDADAVQERCTAKATAYTALGAASIVTKTVKNILMNEAYPKQVQWNIRESTQNTMTMFPNNYVHAVSLVELEDDVIETEMLEEYADAGTENNNEPLTAEEALEQQDASTL